MKAKTSRRSSVRLLPPAAPQIATDEPAAPNQDSIWKAIVLLNEGVYKIWGLYITWYTWFFGSNLIVLSWIFVNKQAPSFESNKASVCGIWVVMNVLGTTTSTLLALHSYRINRRIRELIALSRPPVDRKSVV